MASGFNPTDPDFLRDPNPTLDRLLSESAVHPCVGGVYQWAVVGHEAIVHETRHAPLKKPKAGQRIGRRLEPAARAAVSEVLESYDQEMLWLDPPEHTRQRKLVTKAFTPRSIDSLRPTIKGIVNELIDSFASRGRVELVREFAFPMTERVIADLLGIPRASQAEYLRWNADLSAFRAMPFTADDPVGQARRAGQSFSALRDLILTLLPERRSQPDPDLLSALANAEVDGERLSDNEIVTVSVVLLRAGHHTTANLITSAVYFLLQHPEQLKRLREDSGLLGGAIEEVLRWAPPISGVAWEASASCTMGGNTVAAGDQIAMYYAAANRDPAVQREPGRFDIERSPNPHLSFGQGIHYCLGAYLARTEAELALEALLARLPGLALDGETFEWQPSAFRGLVALPLAFQLS